MTLLLASFWPSPLAPHIESISSMNIMDGFYSLAMVNRVLINFSLSPTYFEMRSAEDTEKKVPSASVAQAFAKYVFPVPGGYLFYLNFYSIH